MAVELSKALKDIASIREREVRPHTTTRAQQPVRAGESLAASHRALAVLCVRWPEWQSALFEQIHKEHELAHFSNGQPAPAAPLPRTAETRRLSLRACPLCCRRLRRMLLAVLRCAEPVPFNVLQDGYRQAFILAADEFKSALLTARTRLA